MFRLCVLVYLLPLLLAALLGWSIVTVRSASHRPGADIVAVLPHDQAVTLHPYLPANDIDAQLARLVYQPLITIDATGHIGPALAREWHWSKTVSLWFPSASAAQQAQQLLHQQLQANRESWLLRRATVSGSHLSLDFTDPHTANVTAAVRLIEPLGPQPLTLLHFGLTGSLSLPQLTALLDDPSFTSRTLRRWSNDAESIDLIIHTDDQAFARDIGAACKTRQLPRPKLSRTATLVALEEPVLTFTLAQTARWHSGQPITAADLRATLRALLKLPPQGRPIAAKSSLRAIDRIETHPDHPDQAQVFYRIHSGAALCDWIDLAILPAAWWQAQAGQSLAEALRLQRPPPGSGPLKVETLSPTALTLRPAVHSSSDAHRPAPHLVLAQSSSPLAISLAAHSAALDVVWPPPEQQGRLSGIVPAKGFDLHQTPPQGGTMILWNAREPPLDDLRVRRALALAADRDALAREAMPGLSSEPWAGWFAPRLWLSSSPSLPLPNAAQAEALLAQAGYLKNITGLATQPAGSLVIDLLIDPTQPHHPRLAEALAEQWRAIGVVLRLTTPRDAADLAARIAARQYHAVLTTLPFTPTWDILPFWHSDFGGEGGSNITGLRDRQLDLWLEALAREFHPEAAARRTHQIETRLLEAHACLPLLCPTYPVAIRRERLKASTAAPSDSSAIFLRELFLHRSPAP